MFTSRTAEKIGDVVSKFLASDVPSLKAEGGSAQPPISGPPHPSLLHQVLLGGCIRE